MANNGARDYLTEGPRDPLRGTLETQQENLFKAWSKAATGHSYDAVIGAAANALTNGVRQCYTTRAQAEARFDEVVGKAKARLMNCYDGVSGKRHSVFPSTQFVNAVHHVDDDFKK